MERKLAIAIITFSLLTSPAISQTQPDLNPRPNLFTIETDVRLTRENFRTHASLVQSIVMWREFMNGRFYVNDVCKIVVKYPNYEGDFYTVDPKNHRIHISLKNIEQLRKLVAESIIDYLIKEHSLRTDIVRNDAIYMLKREFAARINPQLTNNVFNYVIDPKQFRPQFLEALTSVRSNYSIK